MALRPKITPFLWFDADAEAAFAFYVSLFPDSRVTDVVRYGAAGPGPAGSVMTISAELDGQRFTALNGGPHFRFTEAVSFVIDCASQDEVDHYWDGLLAGGGTPSRCGWLKDRFGLSWQVVPRALIDLLKDPDPARSQRVMAAMMRMAKIDVATLESAANGTPEK